MSDYGAIPILCYVTDRRSLPGVVSSGEADFIVPLMASIERAVAAGVDWIQVREKDLEARHLETLVRRAVEISGRSARILVNDRLDVCLLYTSRCV